MPKRTIREAIAAFYVGDAGADDPLAGVISERAWLYASGEDGRTFPAPNDTHIKIRGDGYSSAHSGGCAIDPEEDPAERLIRAANLNPREAEITRRRAARQPSDVISNALGFSSLRAYERAVAKINAKVAVYAAAVRAMSRE